MRFQRLAIMVVAILVLGCTSTSTSPATSATGSRPPTDRVAGWRSDLARILPGLVAFHPDPFHGTPRSVFDGAIAELASGAPTLSDDAMLTGIMRTVALVSAKGRDGHTGAFIWGEGTYRVHSLPLRLWLFPDGPYVVGALPPTT